MLTALIAEDEHKICLLIAKLVDWNALGIQLIGSCSNGMAALEIIQREHPNIVVTDIRMPMMNGIELIRAVREQELPCEFIIISGYKQFEYAHSALQFGVSEYLLKPISKVELTNSLMRAASLCKKTDITQPTGNRQMWKMRQDLRNSLCNRLMDPGSEIELSAALLNEQYHVNFHADGLFQTAMIVFYGTLPEHFMEVVSALVEDIRAIIDPVCWESIPFVQDQNRVLIMMNYAQSVDIEDLMRRVLTMISEHISPLGENAPAFSLGVGRATNDMQRLRETSVSAGYAAFCGAMRRQNEMWLYDKLDFDSVSRETVLPATMLSQLRMSAEVLDAHTFFTVLRAAFFNVTSRTDPAVPIEICRVAAETLVEAVRCAGYSAPETREINDMCLKAMLQPSYAAFVQFAAAWMEEQIENALRQRQEFGSRPIHNAKKYIQEHYMEPLTLEAVAEVVHLNSSYFSLAFKKETGLTFSDHVTNCRMEAAKRLLRESDWNVADISEAVGYADHKYFSRKFTKYVGANPSAYRMLWG